MYSNQSPSAPAPGFNPDEKGHPAPPSYQDHPQYPNPAQGYPAQGYPAQGYPPQGYPPQQGYGYPPQAMGAVTVQPVYITRAPLANPVNDHLGYSIFTLLCCFMPLGIAALIYSILARDANQSGDQLAAERNSNRARVLNHASLGIGITLIIIMIVYVAVVSSHM